MYIFLIIFHIVASLALILIVLLQTGRGAEMGAAFGGASQTLFGGSGGSSFMSKLTTGAAIVFMLTCLGLSYITAAPKSKSIMEDAPVAEKRELPALPDAKPVEPSAQQQPAAPAPAQPSEQAAPAQSAPAPVPVPAAQEKAPAAQEPAKAQEQPRKEEKKPAPAAKPQQKQPDKSSGAKKP